MRAMRTFLLLAAAVLSACFCEIHCGRSARSRGHGAQDLNARYESVGKSSGDQQHQVDGEGETSTKIASAPTALESRFNSPPKDPGLDRVNRQAVDPLLSPNPQKPSGWNTGLSQKNYDLTTSGDLFRDFPEKIKLGAYPNTGSYNYYGVGDSYNYGNGYQSNSRQPFPGYRSTSNIGVVPPKGVNIAEYYGSMLGYPDTQRPKNAGVFERLFSGQKQGYYGSYGFGNNAYKNVLAGLLIWNLMHGLTNYRYDVYNHYNQPEMIPKNTSLAAGDVLECPKNVTMICETSTRALCTVNGTIICISTESCTNAAGVTPKNATGSPCANNKKCVTNVNIVDDAGRESVFCVTTFATPQVPEDDPCKTRNAGGLCLPNTAPKSPPKLPESATTTTF